MVLSLKNDGTPRCIEQCAGVLNNGGVAIIPTDTIYGIVARYDCTDAISRIYDIKGRDENKPFLVLLPSINDVKHFSNTAIPEKIRAHIPGALTVIMPLKKERTLSFTKDTLAIRVPDNTFLQELLPHTGPIVAPSANHAGIAPSNNISEIIEIFEKDVDLIIDGGDVSEVVPSTIYDCVSEQVLRKGAVTL